MDADGEIDTKGEEDTCLKLKQGQGTKEQAQGKKDEEPGMKKQDQVINNLVKEVEQEKEDEQELASAWAVLHPEANSPLQLYRVEGAGRGLRAAR